MDHDHPRERLLMLGAHALSDVECLALILDGGNPKAMDQARAILAAHALSELPRRAPQELATISGAPLPRVLRLAAAIELAVRLRSRPTPERPRLSSPDEVANYYAPRLEALQREVFHVALLDSQNSLLRDVQVSVGSLSASIVHPREVFRTAILEATAHIVLVHNHPSGDPTPSKEDIHLTRQLVQGGHMLGIRIHDHVIIGHGTHVSLAQRGIILEQPDHGGAGHPDPLRQLLRRLRQPSAPGRRQWRRNTEKRWHQLRDRRPDRLPQTRRHRLQRLGRRDRLDVSLRPGPGPAAHLRGGHGSALRR